MIVQKSSTVCMQSVAWFNTTREGQGKDASSSPYCSAKKGERTRDNILIIAHSQDRVRMPNLKKMKYIICPMCMIMGGGGLGNHVHWTICSSQFPNFIASLVVTAGCRFEPGWRRVNIDDRESHRILEAMLHRLASHVPHGTFIQMATYVGV